MAQASIQTTARTAVQSVAVKAGRLFFVDHLRAALVILVVLHHVALVYGGIPPFYYLEPPTTGLLAWMLPMILVLLNQAWFMGAFFLLAGYFTPGSYNRKGAASFLKDRLVRLGIPLLVFYFVLSPISSLGIFLMPASMTGITAPLTWQTFWQMYPDLVGLGPMWFVAMLLIFDVGYVGWRKLRGDRASDAKGEAGTPSYAQIAIFVLALALISYLVRVAIPLGKAVLDFPTLAYLPQYLSFFVVGAVAYRHDWLRRLSNSKGAVGFVAALASLLLFVVGFLSFLKAIEAGVQQIPPFGFGTWQSGVYALWDSMFAVGMCLAAITFFRRFFNQESKLGSFLAQQSYAVYIIHIPIIVFLAYLLMGISLAPLVKLAVATLIVVPTCFVVAYIIRRIPGVSRII